MPKGRPAPAAVPSQCEVCRMWSAGPLCADCRLRFVPPRRRCLSCGLAAAVERCGACVHDPPPWQRFVCLADYGFPWDRLIARLKYQAAPELARLLAAELALAAHTADAPLPQAFVAVPLSRERLAERGYDQAHELARWLARATAVPVQRDALERRFDGRHHQVQSTRAERLRNLRGAFAAGSGHAKDIEGRHLALVDDVVTTGATAREAAAVLLATGAARVDLWVVARTSAPDADSG